MHLDCLVSDRKPSCLRSHIRTTCTEARSMTIRKHARKSHSELEVLCKLRLNVSTYVVTVVIIIVDVTLLSEISERCKITRLIATALNSHIMLLCHTGTEYLVDVIHIVPSVIRIIIEHHLYLILGKIRYIIALTCYCSGRKLVHHLSHIIIICELRTIHEIREVCVHGSTHGSIVCDLRFSGITLLCRNDDHTV